MIDWNRDPPSRHWHPEDREEWCVFGPFYCHDCGGRIYHVALCQAAENDEPLEGLTEPITCLTCLNKPGPN